MLEGCEKFDRCMWKSRNPKKTPRYIITVQVKYIIQCKEEVIDGGLSAEVENKIPITGKNKVKAQPTMHLYMKSYCCSVFFLWKKRGGTKISHRRIMWQMINVKCLFSPNLIISGHFGNVPSKSVEIANFVGGLKYLTQIE